MAQPLVDHDMDDELDFHVDSDSEDEQLADQPNRPHRGGGPVRDRMPLHHFLRLIAPNRADAPGPAASNDELVNNLKRAGTLSSERTAQAMRVCARDLFVVEQYREEALVDAPIRVEEMEFNISAPHMHATCLEALQLQPGHKVLDVGSGCGVLTACCAYLVGKGGAVVGMDIRRGCFRLGMDNVRRLAATSAEYASTACPIRFERQDIFMPTPRHVGQYDRVHVGASCTHDRLGRLVALLKEGGGMIVIPVAPSDLRVITKLASGEVTEKVISQVRFSELDVPQDVQVLLADVKLFRRQRTAPPSCPSTYPQDVAAIHGRSAGSGGSSSGSGSYDSTPGAPSSTSSSKFRPSTSPTAVLDGLPPTPDAERCSSWPSRLSKLLTACHGGSGKHSTHTAEGSPEGMVVDGGDGLSPSPSASSPPLRLRIEELGEEDYLLIGAGWQLPVHRSVLRARCEHFRARCDSGMRDAHSSECGVPDHFSKEAVEAFLHYAYHDALPEGMEPEAAVGVLHVAQYYGTPRLVHLCEVTLGRVLKTAARRYQQHQQRVTRRGGEEGGQDDTWDDQGVCEAAPALLALADDCGLTHLRAVALDFTVNQYCLVCSTESYASLSRHLVGLVAEEACRLYTRLRGQVESMNDMYSAPGYRYS